MTGPTENNGYIIARSSQRLIAEVPNDWDICQAGGTSGKDVPAKIFWMVGLGDCDRKTRHSNSTLLPAISIFAMVKANIPPTGMKPKVSIHVLIPSNCESLTLRL